MLFALSFVLFFFTISTAMDQKTSVKGDDSAAAGIIRPVLTVDAVQQRLQTESDSRRAALDKEIEKIVFGRSKFNKAVVTQLIEDYVKSLKVLKVTADEVQHTLCNVQTACLPDDMQVQTSTIIIDSIQKIYKPQSQQQQQALSANKEKNLQSALKNACDRLSLVLSCPNSPVYHENSIWDKTTVLQSFYNQKISPTKACLVAYRIFSLFAFVVRCVISHYQVIGMDHESLKKKIISNNKELWQQIPQAFKKEISCNTFEQFIDWILHNTSSEKNFNVEASILAVMNNDLPILESVITQHPEILSFTGSNQGSLLIVATLMGNKELVEWLIQKGGKEQCGFSDTSGAFPFMLATDKEIIALLDQNPVDVNGLLPNGQTALVTATYKRMTAVVELLLELGADVNRANNVGQVPLHALATVMSSSEGCLKSLFNLLINHGADPIKTDKNGASVYTRFVQAYNVCPVDYHDKQVFKDILDVLNTLNTVAYHMHQKNLSEPEKREIVQEYVNIVLASPERLRINPALMKDVSDMAKNEITWFLRWYGGFWTTQQFVAAIETLLARFVSLEKSIDPQSYAKELLSRLLVIGKRRPHQFSHRKMQELVVIFGKLSELLANMYGAKIGEKKEKEIKQRLPPASEKKKKARQISATPISKEEKKKLQAAIQEQQRLEKEKRRLVEMQKAEAAQKRKEALAAQKAANEQRNNLLHQLLKKIIRQNRFKSGLLQLIQEKIKREKQADKHFLQAMLNRLKKGITRSRANKRACKQRNEINERRRKQAVLNAWKCLARHQRETRLLQAQEYAQIQSEVSAVLANLIEQIEKNGVEGQHNQQLPAPAGLEIQASDQSGDSFQTHLFELEQFRLQHVHLKQDLIAAGDQSWQQQLVEDWYHMHMNWLNNNIRANGLPCVLCNRLDYERQQRATEIAQLHHLFIDHKRIAEWLETFDDPSQYNNVIEWAIQHRNWVLQQSQKNGVYFCPVCYHDGSILSKDTAERLVPEWFFYQILGALPPFDAAIDDGRAERKQQQ